MKRQLFLLATLLMTIANSSMAQIKYSGGNICINEASKNTFYGLSIDKWPGMYWTCKGHNFFQLDVTPTNPRIAGTGNQVVFFNTATSTFNSIQVANVYNYSDERAKKNIQGLNNGLSKITLLNPVSYDWKEEKVMADSLNGIAPSGPIEKGVRQYGFLAQDIEKVMPDVVATDENGFKMVNYIAIIPVLVKAVQELQSTVSKQSDLIKELIGKQSSGTGKIEKANKILSCSANDSGERLSIATQLDDGVTNAHLVISSISGEPERTIPVSAQSPNVDENISSLQKGIHIVGLYVDNGLSDSKNWVKE